MAIKVETGAINHVAGLLGRSAYLLRDAPPAPAGTPKCAVLSGMVDTAAQVARLESEMHRQSVVVLSGLLNACAQAYDVVEAANTIGKRVRG